MSEIVSDADSLLLGLKGLFKHVPKRRKRQLFLVLSLMLLGAFAEIVTLGALLPFLALLADPGNVASYPLVEKIIGVLGWSAPERILMPFALFFAGVAIVAAAIRLLLSWTVQRFVFQLGHDLSVEVYRRTLCQPYYYHISKNTSELIAAVTKIDAVVAVTLLYLMQMTTAVVISVFIVGALVAINPVVAISAATGFALIYASVTYATNRRLRRNSAIWASAQGERVKALQEGFGGIRDVALDQTQPTFISWYSSVDAQLRSAEAVNAFVSSAPRYIIEACGIVLIATTALILSRGSGGLVSALPVLGVLALGAQRLLPLLQNIYFGWTHVVAKQQSLADVVRILDLPNVSVNFHQIEPIPFKRKIALENVSFRYVGNHPLVLDEITLTIHKGARVGFIGKTGSGKSTIVDLIMGLLEPSSGKICIDGMQLTTENVRGWQAQIAHVPQVIYLADTSIAYNIAFGVPKERIDLSSVRDAARRSELAEFIESLPAGYDTFVGERGIRLSGGQRQRIGIARALYKKASVLVFDEATSALDSETETAVLKSIGSLGRDLTMIIIAHRLSTVEGCDEVFCLADGRVAGKTFTVDRTDRKAIVPAMP
jgi:ABC-type multidrug transport system fused ATPase/permease subunit